MERVNRKWISRGRDYNIPSTDKLKIRLVLSYVDEKEVKDWRELYLKSIEDLVTGKLVYPTSGTFLTEVHKAFQSVD